MTDVPHEKYIGERVGQPARDEAEHFIKCPTCGGWSDLWKLLSGDMLRMVDVISLLIAVPTTIVYKLTYNAVPITATCLITFEQTFVASAMAAAGLALGVQGTEQRATG